MVVGFKQQAHALNSFLKQLQKASWDFARVFVLSFFIVNTESGSQRAAFNTKRGAVRTMDTAK